MKQTRGRKDKKEKKKKKKKKRDKIMCGHVSGILNRDFIELTAKFMNASARKYRSKAGRVTQSLMQFHACASREVMREYNLLIVK